MENKRDKSEKEVQSAREELNFYCCLECKRT